MTKTCILLILSFLGSFHSFAQKDTSFIQADHYKTDKFEVAIFPLTYSMFISAQRFTPTREEIDMAETSLAGDLKALNHQMVNQSSSPVIHKSLNKYKRQYFGYTDENGNRILFINCFWSNDKDNTNDWLKNIIEVFDGGSYYWSVKFNLDKKQLFELSVNGYA